MKQRWFFAAIAVASGVLPMGGAVARSALDRDLEGYAIASCMIASRDTVLMEQGQGWAGAIVQRSHGPIEIFSGVSKVVNEKIRVSGFAVGHQDGPVQSNGTKLFMLTCGEIIDQPSIVRAVARARLKLARYYKKSR